MLLALYPITRRTYPTVPEMDLLGLIWDVEPNALPYWGA